MSDDIMFSNKVDHKKIKLNDSIFLHDVKMSKITTPEPSLFDKINQKLEDGEMIRSIKDKISDYADGVSKRALQSPFDAETTKRLSKCPRAWGLNMPPDSIAIPVDSSDFDNKIKDLSHEKILMAKMGVLNDLNTGNTIEKLLQSQQLPSGLNTDTIVKIIN